ncbi:MAG: hypothetical protein Q4C64_02610 [Erysipelotrichia bacterium]|nr:hypothetical protein [Erysipelotrichia bacterium]
MRKVSLSMKEQNKYSVVKEFVDHGGNKKRAAFELGITVRHFNRLVKVYREKGKDGFVHHNKNRQPSNSFPKELRTTILNLYCDKYQECNFSHFRDLLAERENIFVSYSFIYRLLVKNGYYSVKVQIETKKTIS